MILLLIFDNRLPIFKQKMNWKLLTILCGLLYSCSFQPAERSLHSSEDQAVSATYILTRHAEKAAEGGKDPILNDLGTQRAERLAGLLKTAGIDAVYSTPYQRTRLTANPLAEFLKLEVLDYDPFAQEDFEKIRKAAQNKKILIVGHSNTIPNMVNQLLGEERFEQLEEMEYDKLFIVTKIGDQSEALVLSY